MREAARTATRRLLPPMVANAAEAPAAAAKPFKDGSQPALLFTTRMKTNFSRGKRQNKLFLFGVAGVVRFWTTRVVFGCLGVWVFRFRPRGDVSISPRV